MSETWWQYVERVAPAGESQVAIAKAIKVDKTTVWRWKNNDTSADHEVAIRVARAYKRPVTEALLAAGHIREDEANLREIKVKIDPSQMKASDLAAEIRRLVDELRRRARD